MQTVNLTERDMIRCQCGGEILIINPESKKNAYATCRNCEVSFFLSELAEEQGVETSYFTDMLQEDEQ